MTYRTDPFTRTPGIAGNAYINMHYAEKIIQDFENEDSYRFIYKIVGLRGSGKSVEYSQILDHFKNSKGWLVYALSAAGNPLETLISKLSKEQFIDSRKHTTTRSTDLSANGSVKVFGATGTVGVSTSSEDNEHYYSDEAALSSMIQKAEKKKLKVLIGIDDIARTQEMTKFLSIFGALLLEGHRNIHLVCTGLSRNIEDFTEERNLTFFKRSDTLEIKGLSKYEVAAMYQKLLGTDSKESADLAKFVKGYAYAYQVMGSLYFNKDKDQTISDLVPAFERIIFQDSYDLIWKSLTVAEQDLVRIIVNSKDGKVCDIKEKMDNPASFNVLRSRLEKKHLLDLEERGYLKINLPQFKEYIDLWG